MGSPVTLSHLTLSDTERSKLGCRIWSKIVTCIVRYCVRVNPDFNWFSLQQSAFDSSLQKIANVIPTAAGPWTSCYHCCFFLFLNGTILVQKIFYPLLQIAAKRFLWISSPEFSSQFGICEILKIEFFSFPLKWDIGVKNFKALLLLQIAGKIFQTSPAISSEWSS